jgi:hypothetical protein
MNDINDSTQTQPTPEPQSSGQSAGFCQHCGRPLTTETIRQVGPAVYCEPCLAARLTGAPGSVPPPPGYRPVNVGPNNWTGSTFNGANVPNPGLAALLGLIPGVGAMYNEQYAKGIVHLIVFAVLVSLSDNVNGIFGLFIAGWVCYMAIEAHHTARARRDGTPLPNPFGLNDIGDRLGFGKSWPAGPNVAEVAHDAAAAGGFKPPVGTQPPPSQTPYQTPYQTPAASWGAPTDAYAQPPYTQAPYTQPFVDAAYNQAYRDAGYGQTTPPVPPASPYGAPYTQTPYAPVPPFDPAAFAPRPNRFPAGAVLLIGLGTIFLLMTTGIFSGFPPEALVGCVLVGICAWLFLRRMTDTGAGLASDGTPGYSLRVFRALRGSVWIGFLGVLFLLAGFHILSWPHSWPLLIILAGVMALLQRAVYQASAVAAYMPPPPTPPVTEPVDTTKGGN